MLAIRALDPVSPALDPELFRPTSVLQPHRLTLPAEHRRLEQQDCSRLCLREPDSHNDFEYTNLTRT
jgi:hypothetical protein